MVATNATGERVREAVLRLERNYLALQLTWFNYSELLDASVRVVLLDGMDDLEPLGYQHFAGVYLVQRGFGEAPTLVLPSVDTVQGRRLAVHELSHRFIGFYFPSVPLWFSEGFAEYLSMMKTEPGSVTFGQHYLSELGFGKGTQHEEYVRLARMADPSVAPDLAELQSMGPRTFYLKHDNSLEALERVHVNYVAAWAAVQALNEVGGPQFSQYLSMLYSAKVREPEAWAQLTGALDMREIAHRQRRLLTHTGVQLEKVDLPELPAPQVTEQPLSQSEGLALLSRIWNTDDPKGRQQSFELADRAVALDSRSPIALRARAFSHLELRDTAAAISDLKRAAQFGNFAPAHVLALAEFYYDQPRLDAAQQAEFERLATILVRRGSTAPELEFAARYLFERGKPRSARQFIAAAIKRDSSCYWCYATYARIVARMGSPSTAYLLQQMSIHLTPHEEIDERAFQSLDDYERQARARRAGKAR